MKLKFSKIYHSLIAASIVLAQWSCSNEHHSRPKDELYLNDNPMIMLDISPIEDRTDGSSVSEKVKSLRIIMVHEADGEKYIEANEYIDYTSSPVTAAGFRSYIYQKRSVPGKKTFYLFANEESVENILLRDGGSFPEWMESDGTLTTFLKHFEADMPDPEGDAQTGGEEKDYSAAEFESLINEFYFAPEYEPRSNEIYLPYTAQYEIDLKAGDQFDFDNIKKMYLVPVATKFHFRFINKRQSQAAVDKIMVTAINSQNYLMARVAGAEQKKKFYDDNKEYYWIDWLAMVSAKSWENAAEDKNIMFNEKYGWIDVFEVPDEASAYSFIDVTDDAEPKVGESLQVSVYQSDADIREIGPIYLPESRHVDEVEVPTYDDKTGVWTYPKQKMQAYFLELVMRDDNTNVEKVGEFKDVYISNLKSLFRNTSVYITVTMQDGNVNVYAEINKWTPNHLNGYVQEEDDM